MNYILTLALTIATFHLSSTAEAALFRSSNTQTAPHYTVQFPERAITISTLAKDKAIISEHDNKTSRTIPLFEVGEIRSISRFKQSPEQNKWQEFLAKSPDGSLETGSTWFMVGTEKGYHFLRRRFKKEDKTNGSLYHVFTLPGDGHKLDYISVGYVNDQMSGMHFIISIKPPNSQGETLVVREADLEQRIVAHKFMEMAPPSGQNRLQIVNNSIVLKDGDHISLDLKPIDVSHLPGNTIAKAPSRENPAATAAIGNAQPASASPDSGHQMETSPPPPIEPPPGNRVVSSEFVYNDIPFVFLIDSNGPEIGTYLIRKKDSLRIKISSETVFANYEKLKVEQGIFSFSHVRKIDLDKFDLEAGMKWVPEKQDVKNSQTKSTEDHSLKVNDPPVTEFFEDYHELSRTHIPPISIRESLISYVLGNVSLTKSSSTILTGESGDIVDIIAESINRMPRTWKVLVLDSASFGAGLGTSGAKEEKVLEMERLSKKAITIFYAEDFETFKGLGAVSGDSRDALTLLRKPLRNGNIKIIGTGQNDFKQRVADPTTIQAMQVRQVEALTQVQIIESITQWMRHQPRFANFDYSQINRTAVYEFNPISYLMQTSRNYNVSEMEPNRSIKLLEKVKLPLTRESIDFAARELYGLHASIIERKAKFQKLENLVLNLDQTILGHSHLKKNLYEQTEKFLTMQHDRKGPAVRLWLEGPPGVGKTELAKEYATAMGLEHDVIEMATIVDQDQLMRRIRNQLDRHPFSVIILDEVDKVKDKTVYESMLTMMNQETFTYTEQTGEKKTYTMSAANAKIVVTSNLTDDLVMEFYSELSDEEKDLNEAELAERFFKKHSISDLIEHMVRKGMPRPFIDRFMTVENGISYAFPPSTDVMAKLLEFKLRSGHKAVQNDWGVEILLKQVTEFCRRLAIKYREQNLSTRTTLGLLQTEVNRIRGSLYRSDSYSPGSRYMLDLLSGQHARQTHCKAFYK